MHEYKFERIELSKWNGQPKKDYQDIIHQNANDGWKLIQIFAPSLNSDGTSAFFDIIFEKEKNI